MPLLKQVVELCEGVMPQSCCMSKHYLPCNWVLGFSAHSLPLFAMFCFVVEFVSTAFADG